MAVSKRLRFEILRRDGFKCRYCHAAEVLLAVDHIKPIALGGSDHPSNLVASCDDCNTGKSSTGSVAAQPELADDEYEAGPRTVFDDFGDQERWPRLLRDNPSEEDINLAREYVTMLRQGKDEGPPGLIEFLMNAVRRRDLFALESFYIVALHDAPQNENA